MEESSSENAEKVISTPSSKPQRGLHGPSVGVGAGIAIVSIIAAFLAMSMVETSPELELEEKTPNQEAEEVSLSLFTANGSPYLGDENAPITLVEFGDYQCFFCNKFFHETENAILKNYVEKGKVKIIFKDFVIIGPDSHTAAQASHCAGDQGKFWEYHDTLYNNWNGENNGWASQENLLKFSQDIELEQENFVNCMNDKKYQPLVDASSNDARTLGITGTPAFFVISSDDQITKIGGAQPYEVFERLFEAELQK